MTADRDVTASRAAATCRCTRGHSSPAVCMHLTPAPEPSRPAWSCRPQVGHAMKRSARREKGPGGREIGDRRSRGTKLPVDDWRTRPVPPRSAWRSGPAAARRRFTSGRERKRPRATHAVVLASHRAVRAGAQDSDIAVARDSCTTPNRPIVVDGDAARQTAPRWSSLFARVGKPYERRCRCATLRTWPAA